MMDLERFLNLLQTACFCDKPSISIKMVDVEGGITYRTANCNGLK